MSEAPGQTDPFLRRVASFIDAKHLLAPKASVVVGVSGGPDSVALLAALRELTREPARDYKLTVAHLDHALRAEAADDAAFVAGLAEQWRLPCIAERRDVAARAAQSAISAEEAARVVRYEFLQEAAERAGATHVAVGHHADDNVETILYRVLRGTHLRGLAGIPPSRALSGGSEVLLVRPLLTCRREEIETFCTRARLTWRHDPSNSDRRFTRNFIRHELLPLVRRRLNPRADAALLRLADAAQQAEGVLSELAGAVLARACIESSPRRMVLDAAVLAEAPAPVRAVALRHAMERLGVSMSPVGAERFAQLDELPRGAPPAAVALPGGYVARREGAELLIELPAHNGGENLAVPLPDNGEAPLPGGGRIVCRLGPLDTGAFEVHCRNHPGGVEFLDADKLRGTLVWRPRRDGDAFVPLGSPGRQKVGVFLTNLRLPRRRREAVGCICDDDGIVYLAPLRIADRVRVTAETRRVLRIELASD